jgi:hypothetical protein
VLCLQKFDISAHVGDLFGLSLTRTVPNENDAAPNYPTLATPCNKGKYRSILPICASVSRNKSDNLGISHNVSVQSKNSPHAALSRARFASGLKAGRERLISSQA